MIILDLIRARLHADPSDAALVELRAEMDAADLVLKELARLPVAVRGLAVGATLASTFPDEEGDIRRTES